MIDSDAVQSPGDVMRRLADLERQVRELQAGRRLEAATIGAGGLNIKGGQVLVTDNAGNRLIWLGKVPFGDGTTKPGLVAFRTPADGGRVAMSLYDGILAVWDRQTNIVMSTDEASGQGLATPYFAGGRFASMSAPTDATTGGVFTGLQKAVWRKQHPRMRVVILAQVTSTTAEIRLRINTGPDVGTVIFGPQVLNNGFGFATYGPFVLPGANRAEFEIDLEGRVASGVGQVAARVLHEIGMQS